MTLKILKGCDTSCQMRQGPRAISTVSTGDSATLYIVRLKRTFIQVTAGKSRILSSQGILVSIALEVATSGSHAPTYS